jgi:hypothetical protein
MVIGVQSVIKVKKRKRREMKKKVAHVLKFTFWAPCISISDVHTSPQTWLPLVLLTKFLLQGISCDHLNIGVSLFLWECNGGFLITKRAVGSCKFSVGRVHKDFDTWLW